MHGHTAAVDNKTLRKQIAESGLFTFEFVFQAIYQKFKKIK